MITSPTATTVATPGPATTTEPSPSPTPAKPSRQAPRPADLIAGIQAGLPQLVRDGHLDTDAAKELNKRLEEASRALADGDTEKAWNKLRDVAEKVGQLREERKLTPTGYEALTASLTQLAQTLPRP